MMNHRDRSHFTCESFYLSSLFLGIVDSPCSGSIDPFVCDVALCESSARGSLPNLHCSKEVRNRRMPHIWILEIIFSRLLMSEMVYDCGIRCASNTLSRLDRFWYCKRVVLLLGFFFFKFTLNFILNVSYLYRTIVFFVNLP